jgi:hypothetical protein
MHLLMKEKVLVLVLLVLMRAWVRVRERVWAPA